MWFRNKLCRTWTCFFLVYLFTVAMTVATIAYALVTSVRFKEGFSKACLPGDRLIYDTCLSLNGTVSVYEASIFVVDFAYVGMLWVYCVLFVGASVAMTTSMCRKVCHKPRKLVDLSKPERSLLQQDVATEIVRARLQGSTSISTKDINYVGFVTDMIGIGMKRFETLDEGVVRMRWETDGNDEFAPLAHTPP